MATIELLISRYLDGELTPAEEAHLRRLLSQSPEARATLREMTEVARAARRIPRMHAPQAPLEARLFQRLQAEGLHGDPALRQAPPRASAPAAASKGFIASLAGGSRKGIAVAGLLLLLAVGGGYFRFASAPDMPAHAPIAARFNGTALPAPGAAPRVDGSSVDADRGAMVNIPELRIASADIARPHHERMFATGSHRDAADVRPLDAAPRRNDAPHHENAPTADLLADGPLRPTAEQSTPRTDTVATRAAQSAIAPVAHSSIPSMVEPSVIIPGRWTASFRGGVATVNDDAGTTVRELDMKVGLQMAGGHKVSLIVGMAPSISETRRENTGIGISSPALSQIPPTADEIKRNQTYNESAIADFERTVKSEPWFGLGYNYSLPIVKDVSIDPGMKAGASASAWRIGAELPVSYRMSKNMSVECAFSVARVLPRDASPTNAALTDTPDHFIYEESRQQPSFTTYGVQLGIRLELAK